MLRELPPTAGLPLKLTDFFSPPRGRTLESAIAEYLHVRNVFITSSATAGIVIALLVMKEQSQRSTVVVPGYTCPLVAIAIHRAGLKIKPVDTAPDSFDFDLEKLKEACNEDTLCVIPTHLGGLCSRMNEVMEIARASGAFVLEDAAQSLGAKYKDQFVATIGDINVISLTRGKGLTIYEGGAITTNDDALAERLQATVTSISERSLIRELTQSLSLVGYWMLYNPVGLNIAYGAPLRQHLANGELEKAVGEDFSMAVPIECVSRFRKNIGVAAFSRLNENIRSNSARGRSRADQLAKIPGLKVLQEDANTDGTWPFIMILFSNNQLRDTVLNRLWTKGHGVTRLFLYELSRYAYLKNIIPHFDIPNAAAFSERMLTITNSEWLGDERFSQILNEINDCLKDG
ncbi:MAG TPA: aminotransferase class I/II-fold pyridoxal phosphate-dependent enzyme [Oculatellaceae cyanobacterium]